MCGIYGFSWEDKGLLGKMSRSLAHRGPREGRTHTEKSISMGSRRLGTIDPSKKGDQPIYNEDGSICVIFNGFVQNFRQVREDLIRKGHRFSSETDTEVIVHAYEEFGREFASMLDGMFAFAIWDSAKRKLILARDRHGIKPLHYAFTEQGVIFASEIKALLECQQLKREVNLSALDCYLSFRCNSLYETMFQGIYKVVPGHVLEYANGKCTSYAFPLADRKRSLSSLKHTEEYYAKEALSVLKRSTELNAIADVPLGMFLSGGLDSTAILSLLPRSARENLTTFSAGFENSRHSELKHAKAAADYFGTDHHEVIVGEHAYKALPKIVWHLDEPLADATCIPLYLLSKEMKKHATVVLVGDGGDEMFGGYSQLKFMKLHALIRKIPLPFRKIAARLAITVPAKAYNNVFAYAQELGDKGRERVQRFIQGQTMAEGYCSIMELFDDTEKKALGIGHINHETREFKKPFSSKKRGFRGHQITTLEGIDILDRSLTLADQMLVKTDRCTMAFSLEARVPFLSSEVSTLANSIPFSMKLKGFQEKHILRKALFGPVPDKFLQRPKQYFFAPVHEWLEGEMGEFAKQVLDPKRLREQHMFDPNHVAAIWRGYKGSRLYSARQLYALMTFQIWYDTFILENKTSVPK